MLGTPHILDDEGTELGPYKSVKSTTRAVIRSSTSMTKQRRERRPQPEGWVSRGVVGYLDDEGYRDLTDRRNHMIISGGVNIYPQETENVLVSHPLVVDAAVFGVPDPVMGQSVTAVVQLGRIPPWRPQDSPRS